MKTKVLRTCCFIQLDDNSEELFSVREAAGDTGLPFQISQFFSVEPVLDYIAGNGSFKDGKVHPFPAFVLLDHELGMMAGPDVVRQIRHLPRGRSLPIIVYKDTLHQRDLILCNGTGADHLLTRPATLARTRIMLETLYHCATSMPPDFAAVSELKERCRCAPEEQLRRGPSRKEQRGPSEPVAVQGVRPRTQF